MTDALRPEEPAANVVVYRCPTCNSCVAIVPPGFTITEDELEVKRLKHNEDHQLIKEMVEGP